MDSNSDMQDWKIQRLDSPQREATGLSGETMTATDNLIALKRLSR